MVLTDIHTHKQYLISHQFLPVHIDHLRWQASNDTRDHAIIGGVVPNHRSQAFQQQPSKMLCHLSSSKAVGHPLTACLVERYVIRTSYRDNASCKSRRNTTPFFLYVSRTYSAKMFFAGSSCTGYSRGLRSHMASNERLIVVSPLQVVQKQEN